MSLTRKPVIAVSGVAINNKNELLLIQRKHDPAKGLWTFPGGKVELGETLVSAITREFKEETNLDVKSAILLTTSEAITATHHYVILVYKLRTAKGTLVAGNDAQSASWFALDHLADLPTTKSVESVLHDAGILKGQRKT